MNYKLALELKNAGFPQKGTSWYDETGSGSCIGFHNDGWVFKPNLEELIEACGFCFERLEQKKDGRTPEGYRVFSGWYAIAWDADDTWSGEGKTPEEAVAKLYLSLHAKDL